MCMHDSQCLIIPVKHYQYHIPAGWFIHPVSPRLKLCKVQDDSGIDISIKCLIRLGYLGDTSTIMCASSFILVASLRDNSTYVCVYLCVSFGWVI